MQKDKTNLIVIQPTSLCNLNCRYCYVPHRRDSSVMADNILETTIKTVLQSDLINDKVEFLYHAGEPLTVGKNFYHKAVSFIEKYKPQNVTVHNVIQTNATLINDEWCKFFADYGFKVGVSIDGPEFLHDKNRKNWQGKGSFSTTLRGYNLLKKYGLDLGVLTVLTREHLEHAEDLFHFYTSHEMKHVGFNVEEIENANTTSSLWEKENSIHSTILKYQDFMGKIFDLWWDNPKKITIREITDILNFINYKKKDSSFVRTPDETRDLAILTIQKNGDISSYSPEFAGMVSFEYNNFVIGNILKLDQLSDIKTNQNFIDIKNAISRGKHLCSETCAFYDMCGSGFLSNRYTETGKLDTTESLGCIMHRQALISLIIKKLKMKQQESTFSEKIDTINRLTPGHDLSQLH